MGLGRKARDYILTSLGTEVRGSFISPHRSKQNENEKAMYFDDDILA